MKTFLISIFCLVSALASASPLGVGDPATARLFQANPPPAGGSCTVEATGTTTGSFEFGTLSAKFASTSFVPSCDLVVTGAMARLSLPNGDLPYTVKVGIFSDSAGKPGSQIGSYSGDVSETTIGTTEQDVLFSGLSSSITSGTTYHLVLSLSDFYTPKPVEWHYVGASGASMNRTANVSTWGTPTNDFSGKFKINP